MRPVIYLKKGREASIQRFHPWIFSGAVAQKSNALAEGDVADVYSADKTYLCTGHYQEGFIAVRILTFTGPGLSANFWTESLRKAYALRESLGLCGGNNNQTTAYRLVHGEGDHLPGLVIDYYAGVAVIQAHSAGMFLSRTKIVEALQSLYGNNLLAIYDKSANTAPFKAGFILKDDYLFKSPSTRFQSDDFTIMENGHRFLSDWKQGQKTGFFLDQRENRALLARMADNASVLNLFCYSGGFSISALGGGAALVHSVDASQRAIDLLHQNIALNFPSNNHHEAFTADAFEFLKACPKGKYNIMILDPPAFAKHTDAKKNALQAYKRLNAVAIDRIAKGGILFTFSCSQVVGREEFALAVFSATAISGRKVRILHRLSQAPDHPVNIYHPEGDYLKGLVLFIE